MSSPVLARTCLLSSCAVKVNDSRKYCSSAHSATHRREVLVAEWLAGERTLGDLLKEGHAVRDYIYEQQNNTCALCPCGREWNGMPLNFILDHISGDSSDSRPENLRLICPNCDFQLPTSKGRNRGKGRARRRERYTLGLSR